MLQIHNIGKNVLFVVYNYSMNTYVKNNVKIDVEYTNEQGGSSDVNNIHCMVLNYKFDCWKLIVLHVLLGVCSFMVHSTVG